MNKTIGILTGGGDVPGLNPCIKAVVTSALEEGYRVFGITRGWAGLLQYDPEEPSTYGNNVRNLEMKDVRTVDRTGGTFLHTSRTNPSNSATCSSFTYFVFGVILLIIGLFVSRRVNTLSRKIRSLGLASVPVLNSFVGLSFSPTHSC